MQQQQQQQLMGQVLLLPQMNGMQVRQPQGHTQGAAKQSISGGQTATLYQQMSMYQPTVVSKLPSPTPRQQLSFGPSTAGGVQSPPVQQISTSTGLSNTPGSRPSPPVQQALRSNTATSRQLLTTAAPQHAYSNIPAAGHSLSNACSTTEQEGQGNPIKQLQEASESGCNPLQCTLEHAGGSSDLNVKPKLNMKVPYVRLERLQIDLSTDTELPTFKLLPGSGQDEFSLIIIEGEGLPLNPPFTAPTLESTLTPPNSVSPASVTEIEFVFNERTEVTSKRSHHALSPTPSPSEKSPGSIPDLKASPLCSVSEKGEEQDEVLCVVCGKGGELPCCSHCLKVFHVGCHVPALLSMPSVEWTCSLCVDLATSEVQSESSSTLANIGNATKDGLGAVDQQKCERLLLLLLSHKMCQAFHNPSGASQLKRQPLDLSSLRAKLEKTSTPHYSSPDEFVLEARLLFKTFELSQEKKEVAESVLMLESFFEEKLADVFNGKTFGSRAAKQGLESGSMHCDQTDCRDGSRHTEQADSGPTQPKRQRLDEGQPL